MCDGGAAIGSVSRAAWSADPARRTLRVWSRGTFRADFIPETIPLKLKRRPHRCEEERSAKCLEDHVFLPVQTRTDGRGRLSKKISRTPVISALPIAYSVPPRLTVFKARDSVCTIPYAVARITDAAPLIRGRADASIP
jgi:hypothetical protein